MNTHPTPHDHFFKAVFHQPRVLASTLQGLLPPEIFREIDFDTLTYLPGESIGSSLGSSSRTDLVFSVSLGAFRAVWRSSSSTKAPPILWSISRPSGISSLSLARP